MIVVKSYNSFHHLNQVFCVNRLACGIFPLTRIDFLKDMDDVVVVAFKIHKPKIDT